MPDDEKATCKFVEGGFFMSILFAYNMSLGAFDSEALGEVYYFLAAILFFLATLFLCVIMLNLLIAVISETYVTVQESQMNTMYANMCDLIVENKHIVPKASLDALDKDGDFMYLAKVDETDIGADNWKVACHNLRKTINIKVGQIERNLYEFSQQIEQNAQESKSEFAERFLKTSIRNEIRFKKTMADISSMVGNERDDAPDIVETPKRNKNPVSLLGLKHNESVATK